MPIPPFEDREVDLRRLNGYMNSIGSPKFSEKFGENNCKDETSLSSGIKEQKV